MRSRTIFTGLTSLMLSIAGCASSDANRSNAPSSSRPPSNTTNADRADAAAADDADRYRAEPQSTTAPSRRPPETRTRRPPAQPRR